MGAAMLDDHLDAVGRKACAIAETLLIVPQRIVWRLSMSLDGSFCDIWVLFAIEAFETYRDAERDGGVGSKYGRPSPSHDEGILVRCT